MPITKSPGAERSGAFLQNEGKSLGKKQRKNGEKTEQLSGVRTLNQIKGQMKRGFASGREQNVQFLAIDPNWMEPERADFDSGNMGGKTVAYPFYCTHCGGELTTDRVLFDLRELLSYGGDAPEILKLRLTEEEIRDLYDRGGETEKNGRKCVLPFGELMGYVANSNNLNQPEAAELTWEDVSDFMEILESRPPAEVPEEDDDDDLFFLMPEEEADTDEAMPDDEPPHEWSPAIRALLRADAHWECGAFSEERLYYDLRQIREEADSRGNIPFELYLKVFPTDEGDEVLGCGEVIAGDRSRGRSCGGVSRVCPICGGRLNSRAGSVEHRVVTFLFDREMAEENLITVLTHYAINYLDGIFFNQIWEEAKTIPCVTECRLVEPSKWLLKNLANYSSGIWTLKNYVEKEPFLATLSIKSQAEGRQVRRLLTLAAVPATVCRMDGTLDRDAILNH